MHREDAELEANPRRRRGDVRVARTAVGRGVFAQRKYRPEEIVGEVEGTVISDWDYGSSYCMDLGDIRSLEPDPPFRFMNHSCDANCGIEWYDIAAVADGPPRRRIFVQALKPIRPGEELTIDYAWPAALAIPCRCGAANCRGWIVDRSQVSQVNPAATARRLLQAL